jgi:hypothetical protein
MTPYPIETVPKPETRSRAEADPGLVPDEGGWHTATWWEGVQDARL